MFTASILANLTSLIICVSEITDTTILNALRVEEESSSKASLILKIKHKYLIL